MFDIDSIFGTGSMDNDSMSDLSGSVSSERGIHMEVVLDVRDDPAEEVAKSNLPAKMGYDWLAINVRNQYSIFR